MTDSGVAVVVTSHEQGELVAEAVRSALAQTLAPREVLVVDDGSEGPATRQVLARLESEVEVRRLPHGGVARARNAGVAGTTAPLVVFLDGDDRLASGYLEHAAGLLEERDDLSFVCCALQAFGEASYRWKPPPYTIAEAIGRGACGHISTVFRRSLWDVVGGFDETLPAYEDVDFWLRALEHDLRGVILDEAYLEYRVRRGSRYQSAVARDGYLEAKRGLLDRHRDVVLGRGQDVFATLLDFQREVGRHEDGIRDRRTELNRALDAVEVEIRDLHAGLETAGVEGFEWGTLPRAEAPAGDGPILAELRARARTDLVPADEPHPLVVSEPGSWPSPRIFGQRAIVVDGALERDPDPRAALDRCAEALRPGGTLVVLAATTAAGPETRSALTANGLRALLSRRFDPADVSVHTYGNLIALTGAVAAQHHRAVDEADLREDDPDHPVLVAAVATSPRGRRRGGRPPAASLPRRRSTWRPRRGVVLAYHRIGELDPDVHRLCTPPAVFEQHMLQLARHHRVLPLGDLVRRLQAGEPAGGVAVTFDDGYLDNLELASPVLRELGLPASFFIHGAPSDVPVEPWWAATERILLEEGELPPRLTLDSVVGAFDLPTRTAEERRAALLAVHGRMLDAPPGSEAEVVDALASWAGVALATRDSHRLMTADEVVTLASHPGHEIGAHGHGHLLLPAHDEATRARDLERSKADLERLLGRPVEALAYPYGATDLSTIEIAARAGFAVACTTEPDPVTLDGDPLRTPRFEIAGQSEEELGMLLERAMRPFA